MNMWILLITAIFLVCVTFCIGIVCRCRTNMKKQYELLLQRLDRILSGEKIDAVYDESLDAAVSHRLNRIIEISQMRKEAAEGERDVVKSLISDISHQVRTPLSNITLYTGLLKETILDESTCRLSDKIEKNAEKLELLMQELVKSSYAEQGLIEINAQKVSLDTIIKKGCQLVELKALKKNIELSVSCHGYGCFADSRWTEEVFGNLLENAVKYSPEGSEILVDDLLYESFVCVRIQDKGIGIPEEEQGKIFQRFYRGSNVKDKQGFGIGLYLAREVLRRQGGYIKVKSAPGRGTAVYMFLPCRDFKTVKKVEMPESKIPISV